MEGLNFRESMTNNKLIAQIQQPIAPAPAPIPAQSFQAELIGTLVLGFITVGLVTIKEFVTPWIKRQGLRLSYSRKQDEEIDQILITLLDRTCADRVVLTRFTNGTYTIDGASIKGCLITHEVEQVGFVRVSGYVNSRINSYSNIILKSFLKNGYIKRVTDDIVDTSYRAFLEELGVRFSINYFLAGNDLPLGFISFHYRSANSRMDFEAVSQNEIRRYADAIISKLLSNGNIWTKFLEKSLNEIK